MAKRPEITQLEQMMDKVIKKYPSLTLSELATKCYWDEIMPDPRQVALDGELHQMGMFKLAADRLCRAAEYFNTPTDACPDSHNPGLKVRS